MDLTRYFSQMMIPEIGAEGQQLLSKAKVLVIGAGGLGCPALLYLASTGVGTIGIVDDDTVEIKNLHRQILFDESDIHKLKVEVAKNKLHAINSHVELKIFPERFQNENCENIASEFNVIVDCTDNILTRYLIDETSQKFKIPFVYGAVRQFEGQVAVFNHHNGASYKNLFPDSTIFESELDCASAGILGHVTGLIACFQVNEVLKIILGMNSVLEDEILTIDLQLLQFRKFKIKRGK